MVRVIASLGFAIVEPDSLAWRYGPAGTAASTPVRRRFSRFTARMFSCAVLFSMRGFEHMPSGTAREIEKKLISLNNAELDEVIKRAKYLRGHSVNGAVAARRDPPDAKDWLLEGLYSELKTNGFDGMLPPYNKVPTITGYDDYVVFSAGLRAEFEKRVPNMTRLQKLQLGRVLARAYARELSQFPGVSLRAMLQQIDRLPDAVERSFPGYLRSGVLALLIHRTDGLDNSH